MDVTHGNAAFPATRWTEVMKVCQTDDAEARQKALSRLCTDYWYPLYAFARRMGRTRQDAEDLTQGFFCYVLERNVFAAAEQDLGKLRTFLLRVFQRYIGDMDDRRRALKRGGGQEVLSLDMEEGETRYLQEPATCGTPETLYQRAWALSVLRSALADLGEAERTAGNARQYGVLEMFVDPDAAAEGDYAAAAVALNATVENVRQMVSRLRKRFRDCLRRQIGDTLQDPSQAQIDLELAALRAALRM